jgi:hypothetical protein
VATYYVGIGGNDGNSGLTWALRKLTLNGAEDVPVVAGDTVYVGPGAYRELLTCDVSGGAGTEITYIGDVSGENTDSVGGIVRITGSDNDQTAARANCITATARDYRIFRGFVFDTTSAVLVDINSSDEWDIDDCVFWRGVDNNIDVSGTSVDIRVHRCLMFTRQGARGVYLNQGAATDNTGHEIENCIFVGGRPLRGNQAGDVQVRNCLFLACDYGVRAGGANAGHEWDVMNSIFQYCNIAVRGEAAGQVIEDYNTFYQNATDRQNVAVGGNSLTYPALFLSPVLHAGASQISGFKFPWWIGDLSEWSQVAGITGSNEPTEDFHGIVRPTTAAKNSWGPLQFQDMERETGTVHGGSASIALHDAGVHQIWVPVTNESTTISIYVYREANYAGTNPRMVIKQPGQADDVTTDAAAASQWNQLSTTLTPAADPPYVIVELQSLNTAVAGNFETFFDDLAVS